MLNLIQCLHSLVLYCTDDRETFVVSSVSQSGNFQETLDTGLYILHICEKVESAEFMRSYYKQLLNIEGGQS